MNPNQLATLQEAQTIANQLAPFGGGVKEIFIPEYGGGFAPPSSGESKFYHIRFNNGAVINAGLAKLFLALGFGYQLILEVERG